ncbi:DUF2336 domain-containing protein [bacterium]|nr:DUF2336 domain-containing protein [bacterium]
MSETGSKFSLLIDLAKEPSSEKRRELLREVTDIFLSQPTERSENESAMFDEIVGAIAQDMALQVRAELAKKIAVSPAPLRRTARRFAFDKIEVAKHVLEKSASLTETDILEVIAAASQEHMMSVTRRSDIGEAVSSALVDRGEDRVVASLLSNNSAKIGRETFERVADRAKESPVLHAPFVRNQHVPLDLLNEVYLQVETGLRQEIMKKFDKVSPEALEEALRNSRDRLSEAYGALPTDFKEGATRVADLEKRGGLKPPALVMLLRENQRTAFTIAFAKLVDIEFGAAQRLIDAKDLDALAILARSASFDRALFVTLCMLIGGDTYGMSKAEAFGQLYERVTPLAAQRAVRFWKVRANTRSEAVA